MEPVSKINKRGDLNKRGGRKIFLKSINGEALIRVSRVEKISDNNKRASPFIRKVRVYTSLESPNIQLFGAPMIQGVALQTNLPHPF